MKVKYM